jgi:hypothetical protein
MPVDAVGEVVVAALEAVGDAVLTESPKRGRWRRYVYWSIVLSFFGVLVFGAYLALS